jgi:membrane protein involved in colicin uptake
MLLRSSQESYIFPLRDTFFEGQAAKIPYAYAEVLRAEYGEKSLTNTHYNGHYFDETKREWIPDMKELAKMEEDKRKKAEEKKKAEAKKKEDEKRKKEEEAKKKEDDKRMAEENRKAEELKKAEEKRKAEEMKNEKKMP